MASETAPSTSTSVRRARFKPVNLDPLSRVIYTQTLTALKPLRTTKLDDPKALRGTLLEHRNELPTLVSTINAADTDDLSNHQKLALNLGKLATVFSRRFAAPLNSATFLRPTVPRTKVVRKRTVDPVAAPTPEKKIKDEPLDDDEPCCSTSNATAASANETLSSLLDAQLNSMRHADAPQQPSTHRPTITVARAAPGAAPVRVVVAKRNGGAAARVVAVRRPVPGQTVTATVPRSTLSRPTVPRHTVPAAPSTSGASAAIKAGHAVTATVPRPTVLRPTVPRHTVPVAPSTSGASAAIEAGQGVTATVLRSTVPTAPTVTSGSAAIKMGLKVVASEGRPVARNQLRAMAMASHNYRTLPSKPASTVVASSVFTPKLSKRLLAHPDAAFGCCEVDKPEKHPAHACPFCGLMVEGETRVEHVREMHSDRYVEFTPFICILKECDYRTTSRAEVKKHCLQVHTSQFDYWQRLGRFKFDKDTACPLCSESFPISDLMHLRMHVRATHDVMPTILCGACCETCTTTSELFLHWVLSPLCDGNAKLLDCRQESFLALFA